MNKSDVEVLILSGGKGTRLASVVSDVPKPMAPIKDKPFLELLIASIKSQGYTNFRLLVGHKADVIINHFGDGKNFGINIQYSHEESPLGTGGAIKQAVMQSAYENFLVFNGDTLFEADLDLFIKSSNSVFSIALRYVEDGSRFGQVNIDQNFLVQSFMEKGQRAGDGFINAGIYYFNKSVMSYFPEAESFSIEQDVMPKLVAAHALGGIPLGGKFLDIGIPEDYQTAQEFLGKFQFTNRKKALFLDRDGVIIKDPGYISDIDQVEFFDDIIPIIRYANQNNIHVVIVTNQAGVARGYFSIEKCHQLNDYIIDTLRSKNAIVNDCYICPYHPTKGIGEFAKDSLLRKPHPGMLLRAQEAVSVDVEKSLMIGDKVSDIINLPGLKTMIIRRNYDLSKTPGNVMIHDTLAELQKSLENFYT